MDSNSQTLHQREALIPFEHAGLRVDKVAALLFEGFSRAELSRWIDQGELTVDGHVVKPKLKVFGGELLVLNATRNQRELWQEPQSMRLDILYEDEEILLLNKAPGLVVHPGAGNPAGTLVNGLLAHRPGLSHVPRAGVVHRLDKDTSGIMVVAGTTQSYQALVTAIAQREVERRYIGVCEGVMVAGQDVERPVGRDPRMRTRQAVRDDGKPALTMIRVRERFRAHSLIDAKLGSGRTHQIRVHMQSIGYPLVGDGLYGWRRKLPRGADAATVSVIQGFSRQALHAAKLQFAHPGTSKIVNYSAPVPEDMSYLIDALHDDAAGLSS